MGHRQVGKITAHQRRPCSTPPECLRVPPHSKEGAGQRQDSDRGWCGSSEGFKGRRSSWNIHEASTRSQRFLSVEEQPGRRKSQSDLMWAQSAAGHSEGEGEPGAKESGQPGDAAKAGDRDSTPEPPPGCRLADTLTSPGENHFGHLTYKIVGKSTCGFSFKPLNVWQFVTGAIGR